MGNVPPPRLEGSVVLDDGRSISYAEYGVPDGRPFLWFHGTPGARRQMPVVAREAAAERGVRLVVFDRPGVGGSTGHRYRRLRDAAADVSVVADRLGFEKFGVIGLSGGGPYVLASAHELPDRIISAAVLGGVAPSVGADAADGGLVRLTALTHELMKRTAPIAGFAMWAFLRAARPVGSVAFDLYASLSPEGDQRFFKAPGMKDMFLEDLNGNGRRRFHAVSYDLVQFGRDWGFSLADIKVPVHFWHGDADNIVPVAHGEHMTALVPDADLRVREGESHLGNLMVVGEVLDVLLADWPVPDQNDQNDQNEASSTAS